MSSSKKVKSANTLEGPITEVNVEQPERQILVRCPGCRHAAAQEDIAGNLEVCPRCGHHFRIGARKRISMTVDAESFQEMDADLVAKDFLGFPGYREKIAKARAASQENEAVICGTATVGGYRCALFVMNSQYMMGSMGSVVGEKITRLFEYACEEGLPVVGFTVSGGARMQEGTTSLMQMAKTSGAVRRHSDAGLLYIAVLTDPTTGGVTASFAMEADICLAEPGALVAFAGPRVIEQTLHKRLPVGFQRSEFQLEHGFVDRIVPRAALPEELARLMGLHGVPRVEGDGPFEPIIGLVRPKDENPAAKLLGNLAAAAVDAVQRAGKRPPEQQAPLTEAEEARRSAYELLGVVRSGERPGVLSAMERVFDSFVELHGDRYFGDDGAVVGGIARLKGQAVTVIGTERGRDTKERVRRNFGSASPEGYRKAQRLMRQAEKFGRPVVCLVDTSGAFCGMGAEERGQGEAIARSLLVMSGLRVPIVSVIMGEGGSGGALGLALANRVLMLSGAVYSVVSPEGCASILWKTAERAPEAADALRIRATDLKELGIIDDIIDDHDLGTDAFARRLADALSAELARYQDASATELEQDRYDRFRRMGESALC